MIPWWVLKPVCDLVEAVVNRVAPIPGIQQQAWARTAAFHALEVFEEENETWEPHPWEPHAPRPDCCSFHHPADIDFPGESDGLDWMLSWPERQPDLKAMNITKVTAWMQEHRTTDVVVQCGYCNRVIGDLKKWAAHLMVCDPDDVVPDSATVAASAEESPADAGDTSPEGVIPPTPSGHSKDYQPLFTERRCEQCNYWRGQHICYGDWSKDTDLHCPKTTTFKGVIGTSRCEEIRS